MTKKTIYVILGMHRSGTSLLARMINSKGVFTGDKMLGKSDSNIYGHYEDLEVLKINEKVMKCCGGDWKHTPDVLHATSILNQIRLRFLSDYVHDYIRTVMYKHDNYAFKEPRTTVTFNFWKKNIPSEYDIKIIGIYRRPQGVVNSLMKRDGMNPLLALKLWKEYNLHLLRHIKAYPSILISYEDIMMEMPEVTGLINSFIEGSDINVKDFVDHDAEDYVDFDCSFDKEAVEIYYILEGYKSS